MAVTAKFKVSRKTAQGSVESPWAHEIEMTPDYSGGRNAEWAAATPAGVIRLTIKNELAADQFDVNDSYDVLLTKVES